MIEAFWRSLLGRLRQGEPVVLAVVTRASRHSPGTAGARLWISREHQHGTIGGGVMEKRLVERARECLDRPFFAELEELRHRAASPAEDDGEPSGSDRGKPSGLICAGRQSNLAYLCRATDLPHLERLVELIRTDAAGRLVIDSRRGLSVTAQEEPMELGRRLQVEGSGWRLEEEILCRRRLAIFGGGHCGQALARQMSLLGWRVSLWDTRADVLEAAGDELARVAEPHLVADYELAGAEVRYRALTAAVVMTTDLRGDVDALCGLLELDFPFLGVMGANAKLREIRRRLERRGFTGRQTGRLTAPVGLPIDSDTPAEIAVSVAAQLLLARKRWLGDEKLDA